MIYLDHNATWPMLSEVREAMLPWLGVPANPSSAHRAGQAAAAALERARRQVAALLDRDPAGVVFTSGATEAVHLGVHGLAVLHPGPVWHAALEHPCVLGAVAQLGGRARVLEVDGQGRVQVDAVEAPGLLVLTAAQHETGVLQPVVAAAERCRAHGAALLIDATQAAGRATPRGLLAEALVLSAHKLGGPVGVGALVLRDGSPFPAQLPGVQERGRRGGTSSVALAVGFGVAAELALRLEAQRVARWQDLRAHLEAGVVALGGRVVAAGAPRLANTTLAVFEGRSGEDLVMALDLDGVCVSTGAACASGSALRSAALVAMGDPGSGSTVRFSLGPDSTSADVDGALRALARARSAADGG